jgi:hypothetical protein
MTEGILRVECILGSVFVKEVVKSFLFFLRNGEHFGSSWYKSFFEFNLVILLSRFWEARHGFFVEQVQEFMVFRGNHFF